MYCAKHANDYILGKTLRERPPPSETGDVVTGVSGHLQPGRTSIDACTATDDGAYDLIVTTFTHREIR